LPKVSRSFAPSIALLGEELEGPVGLAYLCCRLLDTIEDSPLALSAKTRLLHDAVDLFKGQLGPKEFDNKLREAGPFQEGEDVDLLYDFEPLLHALNALEPPLQKSLLHCIEEMGLGMAKMANKTGLSNEKELFEYCHIVAGTVGTLLTDYYCYFEKPDSKTESLLRSKSESFAQALQRVNIAADAGRDKFEKRQFIPGLFDKKFNAQLVHHDFCTSSLPYLKEGLAYTLLIEGHHPYRSFCALPILLACRTLSLVAGDERVLTPEGGPKVPREETLQWIVFCREESHNDQALSAAFSQALEALEHTG